MKKGIKTAAIKSVGRVRGKKEARATIFALSSSRIEGIKPSPRLRRKLNAAIKIKQRRSS